MQCPHCHQDLPAAACPGCGQPALPGAKHCFACGRELLAGETPPPRRPPARLRPARPARRLLCVPAAGSCRPPERKLLACPACGRQALTGDAYCPACGGSLGPAQAAKEAPGDPGERLACPDGMCIGILGPDGRCTECGKPYQPTEA